ncbi:phage capsid protein [Breznakia sp. OttesenSCG-928-G09]|nr:phage capsid protein [Breznakia sp. OttesenSCG-928-G09]
MPITLAESKVGMSPKVDQMVIDEFRRGSFLLDTLVFDNSVSPGTGGSTLGYGYVRLETPSTAQFRDINEEYKGNEAKRKDHYAKLKIFGGKFSLDRVIINTSGAVDELDFQMKEKISAALNLFHNTVINGDSAVDVKSFDGLDVMLTGSDTEFHTAAAIDLSTSAKMDANYNEFLDLMNEFVAVMKGKPTMLLMNSTMLVKMKSIARRAGYYSRMEDAFGRSIDMWDTIPLVDLEEYYDGTKTTKCVPTDETTGETSMYAVQIALDGFHGVSPQGDKVITGALPNLAEPGVMKEGDVEMVAAVVLKNTKKAGVFRRIKVQ